METLAALVPTYWNLIGKCDYVDKINTKQRLFRAVLVSFSSIVRDEAEDKFDFVLNVAEAIVSTARTSSIFMGDGVSVWHGNTDIECEEEFKMLLNATMQTTAIGFKYQMGWNIPPIMCHQIADLVIAKKYQVECILRETKKDLWTSKEFRNIENKDRFIERINKKDFLDIMLCYK